MKQLICRCLLAGAALLAPALAHAQGAVLTVRVENVSPKGGNLRLALYNRKNYDEDDAAPVVDLVVPAKGTVDTVTFSAVAPGTYAVKMFQDENCNEEFDQTWLGFPEERYGFSNNARPDILHLGPPSFDDAKIVLKDGANSITIRLR